MSLPSDCHKTAIIRIAMELFMGLPWDCHGLVAQPWDWRGTTMANPWDSHGFM